MTLFDKLHAFKHNYTSLFRTEWTTVKIFIPLCYYIVLYFFRSSKLVPGLIKIVSLPDQMSCKVWRTFVKTVLYYYITLVIKWGGGGEVPFKK